MKRAANREQWRKRVQRWKDSGLTAQEFSSEMGINYRTLIWWNSRLKHDGRDKDVATKQTREPKFIEMTEALTGGVSVAVESGLELLVADVLIKVAVGFDQQTLHQVLSVIRQS